MARGLNCGRVFLLILNSSLPFSVVTIFSFGTGQNPLIVFEYSYIAYNSIRIDINLISSPPKGKAVSVAAIPRAGSRKALQTEQPVAAADKRSELTVWRTDVLFIFFFSSIVCKNIEIAAPIKTAFPILRNTCIQL